MFVLHLCIFIFTGILKMGVIDRLCALVACCFVLRWPFTPFPPPSCFLTVVPLTGGSTIASTAPLFRSPSPCSLCQILCRVGSSGRNSVGGAVRLTFLWMSATFIATSLSVVSGPLYFALSIGCSTTGTGNPHGYDTRTRVAGMLPDLVSHGSQRDYTNT